MIELGLLLIVAGIMCTWAFVGTTVRADARGRGTRMTRPSRLWLLAAIVLVGVGVGLLVRHVVGLWS